MQLTWQQSIGIDESHLLPVKNAGGQPFLVHQSILQPLTELLAEAARSGVAISIISSYRSFDRQLAIWNDKWQGYKPVYSRHGRPLNISQMSSIERYKAICLWSAMPGFSRHHWGTDLDIFATEAIEKGHQVELVPEEFSAKGPCYQLEQWLSENLSRFGFFRPYREYRRGVAVEPWHISHHDTANKIIESFDYDACKQHIESSVIKEKHFIIERLDHYRQQYFCNISGAD
ncbi:M15 family metallopeptidase [Aliikangiella coralliicola]|nr:M15 family metallopeptidase [Aliikangiella coralliicola]